MVDTVTDKLRTINLSAKQLKLITAKQGAQWGDELTNEFLNYLSNITTVAGSTDAVVTQVNINTDGIASNVISISLNADNIETNRLDIEQNSIDIGLNTAAILVVSTGLDDHVTSDSEHGVTGNNIGTQDYPTELVGGAVLLMGLIADAVASTATVTFADIGAAPAAYTQSYAQAQTVAINEIKLKHNTMLTNLNSLVAKFNLLLSNSKTAKQMTS